MATPARAATTKSHSTTSSKRHSSRPLSTAKNTSSKATQAKRRTSATAHSTSKSSAHSVASSRGWSSRHSRRAAHKPPPWTRQHLEPDRVTEIQRALGEAGYFDGQPNGQWDEQTRDAMRRYQADNSFGATGLPDARSLMKLGLGPHALPEDVGRSAPAAAILSTPPSSDSSTPQQ